jgi:hypothetical protein
MSNDQNAIKYVNHNKVRIKACIKREEITKMPFWSSLKKGLTSKKGSHMAVWLEEGKRQK